MALGAIGIGTSLIIITVLFLPAGIFTLPIIIITFGFVMMVFLGILSINKKIKDNCRLEGTKTVCD